MWSWIVTRRSSYSKIKRDEEEGDDICVKYEYDDDEDEDEDGDEESNDDIYDALLV